MGIRSRLKRRLLTLAGRDQERPAERADRLAAASASGASALPITAVPTGPPAPVLGTEEVRVSIEEDVRNNPVLLYMKGSALMPKCGFSAAVVEILRQHDVSFETRDVTTNSTLRQEIKEFSDWPTLPQLYIGGEFVGGCDIVREMNENGELSAALKQALN